MRDFKFNYAILGVTQAVTPSKKATVGGAILKHGIIDMGRSVLSLYYLQALTLSDICLSTNFSFPP